MNSTDKFTIGLDLGDRRHSACVLNAAGDIVGEEQIANTRAGLEAFAARFPGATVVMETGTHSPWVSRLFEARGHRVFVANARKLFVALPAGGGRPCSSPSASLRARPAA
jgi:transposase